MISIHIVHVVVLVTPGAFNFTDNTNELEESPIGLTVCPMAAFEFGSNFLSDFCTDSSCCLGVVTVSSTGRLENLAT